MNLGEIMTKIIKLHLMLFLSLLCAGTAMAGEPARTLLAADLKQEPFVDAAVVSALPANTELEVLKRQGGWMQVKAAAGEGWLKMTNVKLGAGTQAKSGDSGVGSLAKLALTGRSGNTGVTATTGVRGLSAEELKNAKPDPEAVKQLDSYTGNKGQAQSFASAGNLQAKNIEYLSATPAVASSGTKGGR
jgi:hypothetical protein